MDRYPEQSSNVKRSTYIDVYDQTLQRGQELRAREYSNALQGSSLGQSDNIRSSATKDVRRSNVDQIIRSNASRDLKDLNYQVEFRDRSKSPINDYIHSKIENHQERIRTIGRRHDELQEQPKERQQRTVHFEQATRPHAVEERREEEIRHRREINESDPNLQRRHEIRREEARYSLIIQDRTQI